MTDLIRHRRGGSADEPLAYVERIIGAAATKLARDIHGARDRGEHDLTDTEIDALVNDSIDQMTREAVPRVIDAVNIVIQQG